MSKNLFTNQEWVYLKSYWFPLLVNIVIPGQIHNRLNARSIEFLTNVGIPRHEVVSTFLGLDFISPNTQFQILSTSKGEFISLARHMGTGGILALKDNSNEIYRLLIDEENLDKEDVIQFVNSDIESFVIFITIYSRHAFLLEKLTRIANYQNGYIPSTIVEEDTISTSVIIEIEAQIEKIISEFKLIDPKAVSSEETYWNELLAWVAIV